MMRARAKLVRYNKYPAVHRFKEWVQVSSTMQAQPNNGTPGILTFSVNQMTNWASMQHLFDLYKIVGVKVKIIPTWNVNQLSQPQWTSGTSTYGTITTIPNLYIAPNRNPYVAQPTGVNDILNDDGVKIIRLTKPVSLYIKNPKPDVKIYDQSGSTIASIPEQFNSSSSALQPWLSTGGNDAFVDQSNVKHYGFRWWLEQSNGGVCDVQVFYKFYVAFKEQD